MFKAVVSIYVTSDFKECLTLNICHNRNGKKKSCEFFLYLKSFLKKRFLNLVLSLLMNKSTK